MILGHSILTNLERKIEKVPDDVRQALVTCPVGLSQTVAEHRRDHSSLATACRRGKYNPIREI